MLLLLQTFLCELWHRTFPPFENSLAVRHGGWKPSQTPITVCLCQHLETTSAVSPV